MKLDYNAISDAIDEANRYALYIDDDILANVKSALGRYSDCAIYLGDYGVLFVAMLNSVADKDGFMKEALVCLHGFERKDAR